MPKLMEMMNKGDVDSIVIPSPFGKGKSFEELLNVPGSCAASVNGKHNEFVAAYSEGIELMKQDPQGVAEYIAKRLPIQANLQMIVNLPKATTLKIEKIQDYTEFENLVKKYL